MIDSAATRAFFILEPDFDRRRLGEAFEMSLQRAWEVF
jgi:hypothetical protein